MWGPWAVDLAPLISQPVMFKVVTRRDVEGLRGRHLISWLSRGLEMRGRDFFPSIGFFFRQVEGSEASSLTSAECATSGQSRPYMYGDPWVIPGYIEAEYYDYGGNGVSD